MRSLAAALVAAAWFGLAWPALAAEPPICAGASLVAELARREPAALEAAYARSRQTFRHAEGRFFRLEREGALPSHIFGTKHTTDPAVVVLPPAVRQAVAAARVVLVEQAELLTPGPGTQALNEEFGRTAIAPAGTTGFLNVAERRALERAMQARGLPAGLENRLRPWFLNVLLAAPPCESRRFAADIAHLDRAVAEARGPGVPLVSLETIAEQIEAVRNVPEDVSRHVLAWTLKHLDRQEDLYAALRDLYLAGRPVALLDVAVAAGLADEADRAAHLRLVAVLGGERDRRMAERALPHLGRGGAFIAVGALHLVGDGGLLARFEAAGYRIVRLD